MQINIKAWLETAGEPVADTCFVPGEVPPLPYIVFADKVKPSGGDMQNLMKTHALTVERYNDTTDDNATLEELFDAQAIKYQRDKQWVTDMGCFMTTYDFDLIEREVI